MVLFQFRVKIFNYHIVDLCSFHAVHLQFDRKLYGHTSTRNVPEIPQEIDGALVPSANQSYDMCNGEQVKTDCNENRLCSTHPVVSLNHWNTNNGNEITS